jgi:hypothetical protein
VLRDDELALVINRFKRFHNNHTSHRCGGQKEGCFNCGDPDRFMANCPKKKVKYDSSKCTFGKHKSRGRTFDKKALK